MNDIVKCLKYSKVELFADDTLIHIAVTNLEEGVRNLNCDLNSVSKWLKTNKLKLNVNKTKSMVITHKKNIDTINQQITIDNETVESVCEIKYLGVLIDNKLNFNNNVNYICKKMSKKYGLLCRISKYLNINSKITIYKSIISPHIDYCSSLLFLSNETQLKRLQKIQNKIMRVVIGCSRYTSIASMLETLQWLSVKQRIYYNTMIFIYKIYYGLLPQYLSCHLSIISDHHNFNTRNKSNFTVPFYTKKFSQNSLFYKGVQLYNNLPTTVKTSRSLPIFKRECVQYIKQTF